jgi:hypothetical protein
MHFTVSIIRKNDKMMMFLYIIYCCCGVDNRRKRGYSEAGEAYPKNE